jgi:hypothetical protein
LTNKEWNDLENYIKRNYSNPHAILSFQMSKSILINDSEENQQAYAKQVRSKKGTKK